MTEVLLVFCTCPEDSTAAQIANTLVEEGLAACVNRLPAMSSTFRWKGRVKTEAEVQMVIKTSRAGYPALERRLRDLHPYELPEVLAVPVQAGFSEYVKWIIDSVNPPGEDSAPR